MKKKQGHGPIPTYQIRSTLEQPRPDKWAWLLAPDPAERVYDSSLSKPGRICKNCRTFVASSSAFCRSCYQ